MERLVRLNRAGAVGDYRLLRCLTTPRPLDKPQLYVTQNLTQTQRTQQPTVIKFLCGSSHAEQAGFLNERQVLSHLNQVASPHWLPLLDSGGALWVNSPSSSFSARESSEQTAYYVDYILLPYHSGFNVKQLMQLSSFSVKQAWQLWQAMLKSIDALHQQGWLHLDIKPSNFLFFSFDQVCLIDFALAQRIDLPKLSSDILLIQGTPKYMSPEQFLAQPLNQQTDFYALGLILYELLTGKSPFTVTNYSTYATWAQQHCQHPVPLLPTDLAQFQRLIDGLLAKNRYYRLKNRADIQQCVGQIAL